MGLEDRLSLIELVEKLREVNPRDVDKLKYNALQKGYQSGEHSHLDKVVYRSELNKYIKLYSKS